MKNPVKPVSEILDHGQLVSRLVTPTSINGQPESKGESNPDTLSANAIVTMFKTFARRWPHKWEKTNVDPKAPPLWKRDLQALGVTDSLLNRGLHKSGALEWPPCPAEFAALCHPTTEELGLPDMDTAYRRACVSNWTHPAIYEAAKRIGTFEIRCMPESKSRPLFERTYRAVCAEVMAGATFEIPKRTAIGHKPSPVRKEVALAHLAKLKELVGSVR